METPEQAKEAFSKICNTTGGENAARIIAGLAIGWGLSQIGKGISDIAQAARMGYFQK